MDGWVYECMEVWMNGCLYVCIYGCLYVRTDKTEKTEKERDLCLCLVFK